MMKRSPGLVLFSLALTISLAGCGGEAEEESVSEVPSDTAVAPDAAQPPVVAAAADSTLIDPNQATPEQLAAVPGLTPEAANALIAGRPYTDMLQVDQTLMPHLDEAARETVYERVWFPLDLNTATGEEILLIPRLGERMRGEFEEYRPYRAMEQFRQEMGKYVDAAEVARLERYVTIR